MSHKKQPTLIELEQNNVWEIKNFFSAEKCKELIRESEEHGYEATEIKAGGRNDDRVQIRSNDRILWDMATSKKQKDLPQEVFQKLSALKFLPKDASKLYKHSKSGQGYELTDISQMFKFYKYSDDEHFFRPHHDESYQYKSKKERDSDSGSMVQIDTRSFITVLIYLSDVHEGGETVIFEDNNHWNMGISSADENCTLVIRHRVKPETGKALLFVHENLHEGCALPSNSTETKYVLRTDVCYSRKRAIK